MEVSMYKRLLQLILPDRKSAFDIDILSYDVFLKALWAGEIIV